MSDEKKPVDGRTNPRRAYARNTKGSPVSIYMPEEMRAEITARARSSFRSLTQEILYLLNKVLDDEGAVKEKG